MDTEPATTHLAGTVIAFFACASACVFNNSPCGLIICSDIACVIAQQQSAGKISELYEGVVNMMPGPIVLAADRRVLPGLHVTAYSALCNLGCNASPTFYIISNDLVDADMEKLRLTLEKTGKRFGLELRCVDDSMLQSFPKLTGSVATYFRLLAPEMLDVDYFLYLDTDVVVAADLTDVFNIDLGDKPAGFVQEAIVGTSPDRLFAELCPDRRCDPYLSAGVMYVNVDQWRRFEVTKRCLEFLGNNQVQFFDQSALNYVLHRNWEKLDRRFNFPVGYECNWNEIKRGSVGGKILHYMANPKPWNFLGEFVNPYYGIWQAYLQKTAISDYRSWHASESRRFPMSFKEVKAYARMIREKYRFRRAVSA